ncbi:hypothetical protein Mgra_00004606 [Meloidogyne graminicola]|uniref:Uncharacterized protein n=1 Tax=Meloidogyne graminicola TaxID=189291 RepID=A0A8S9ZRX4_9BILA|nr:hypothetical protein Mgra_00004606 [Meloidogyne graminicola]
MNFFIFISFFTTLIHFIDCGFLQLTPTLQTTQNYLGESIFIKSSDNKFSINNINFVSECNTNYPIEEEDDPLNNKVNNIYKLLIWEFQLYKLNENNNNNNWGQQLNKNERENIILISELISWLTLKEHLNINFKKSINLLISLNESDKILEKEYFFCYFFNYLNKINEPKELLYRWTLNELKQNFWNILEINQENDDILFKIKNIFNILNYGNDLINLFEITILACPSRIDAKEYGLKLLENFLQKME